MSADLLVIVDDYSDAFSYSSQGWSVITASDRYFRGTSHRSSISPDGPVNFAFDGTSVAFIGDTSYAMDQYATVQIDNGTPFSIYTGVRAYHQWFTTPTLPDGRHSIIISTMDGKAIDYAVVKVGKNTSLAGQIVVVDDDSSLIQYSGQWSRRTNDSFSFSDPDIPTYYPYGNCTHRSSNPGDNFTFRFSGTYIGVYGTFLVGISAKPLTVNYSIDGNPSTFSFITTAPTTLFFGNDLPPGPHTLWLNITEANDQTFILDYITYRPSFDTLSSMPSISASSSSTTGSASSSTAHGSRHSVSTGAIVGCVFGGVAFVVLVTILVILLILWWRRAQEQGHEPYHDAALVTGVVNDPNILSPNYQRNFLVQEHRSPLQL